MTNDEYFNEIEIYFNKLREYREESKSIAAGIIGENLTEDIVLNERLKDFKFTIGSMTKDELEKYQKLCVIRDKKGNVLKQDSMKFSELVIVNHLLYPNFKSAEFLQKLGVNTPAQGLSKVLKVGEITALSDRIMKFNGFDEDFEDIRTKAKN